MLRVASLGVLLAVSGCLSLAPQPPADLSQPGWTIRQGQAVWRPNHDAVEIAGDLLVATDPSGGSLVQFTKPPLPFVTALRATSAWEIQFFAQKKRYAGRGRPPGRLLWLQLPDGLAGRLSDPTWAFTRGSEGRWHFENRHTSEALDGYLQTTRLPSSHRVQPGDSVLQLSHWYGVTPESLQDANPGPPSDWLNPGQTIHLPALPTVRSP